jgi:hypothetical protein
VDGGNQAKVGAQRLHAADPPGGPGLQQAQQLDLRGPRNVADLVEGQRAVRRHLKLYNPALKVTLIAANRRALAGDDPGAGSPAEPRTSMRCDHVALARVTASRRPCSGLLFKQAGTALP